MNNAIHTGLHSTRAEEVLRGIRRKLLQQTHRYTWFYRTIDRNNIKRANNNEVVFDGPIRGGGDEPKFFLNFAIKLKEIIKSRGLNWSRYNTNDVIHLQYRSNDDDGTLINVDATIQEIYFIYDLFMKRPNLKTKYPSDFYDSFVGMPFDPIRTEMMNTFEQEQIKLNEELDAKVTEITNQRWAERNTLINEITNKLDEKYKVMVDQVREEYADKLAKIKESMSSMFQMA